MSYVYSSFIRQKTDILFLRKESIASFLWEIKDFKRMVAGFEGNTRREPLTSPIIDAHGCKWRMVLQIAVKCSLYLQLVSAATTMHVGIRFVQAVVYYTYLVDQAALVLLDVLVAVYAAPTPR